MEMKESTDPVIRFPNMHIDLSQMRVFMEGKEDPSIEYELIKSKKNERRRGPFSLKANAEVFNIKAALEDNFSSRPGEFGRAWVVKNNFKKNSSLVEIIDGFKKYYLMKIQETMRYKHKDDVNNVLFHYDLVF